MTIENNTTSTQQTAAKDIAEAAWSGAKTAVNNKIVTPLSELIEPGDMNLNHAPHPLNDLKRKAADIQAGLKNLAEPGDMNLEKAPHPVDKAFAAAEQKIETIKAAGPIKGTEIATETIVAAAIDEMNPGKKIKIAGNILEETANASKTIKSVNNNHHEGEYIPASDSKGLAETTSSSLAHAKIPEAVKAELQTVFADNKLTPTELISEKLRNPMSAVLNNPKDVLLQTAHGTKPSAMNQIDARYHGARGDEAALIDNHSLRLARAQLWNKALEADPELALPFKGMDKKGAEALLNDNQFDRALGIQVGERQLPAPLTAAEVKLEESIQNLNISKQSQEALDNAIKRQSERSDLGKTQAVVDTVTQILTPGAANTTGVIDRKLINAQNSDSAVIKEMATLVGQKYIAGKAVVAAGVAGAIYYANHKDEDVNKKDANLFIEKISTSDGQKELVKSNKDFKNVVEQYQLIEAHLMKEGGGLSEQDHKALQNIASNFAKQIQEKGLDSFGEVSKAAEQGHATKHQLP